MIMQKLDLQCSYECAKEIIRDNHPGSRHETIDNVVYFKNKGEQVGIYFMNSMRFFCEV